MFIHLRLVYLPSAASSLARLEICLLPFNMARSVGMPIVRCEWLCLLCGDNVDIRFTDLRYGATAASCCLFPWQRKQQVAVHRFFVPSQ